MPFEEHRFKGWFAHRSGDIHPSHERTNSDYAHGYLLHFDRKNTLREINRTDKGFGLASVKQKGDNLGELAHALRNDEDIVTEAVKQDGLSLRFASANLQRDQEIVELAISQNGWAFEHASVLFQKKREIVELAIKNKPSALQWAHNDIKSDRMLVGFLFIYV